MRKRKTVKIILCSLFTVSIVALLMYPRLLDPVLNIVAQTGITELLPAQTQIPAEEQPENNMHSASNPISFESAAANASVSAQAGAAGIPAQYYRQQLTPTQASVYDALEACIDAGEASTDIVPATTSDVSRAFSAVASDRSDIFWIDGTYEESIVNGSVISVSPEYNRHLDNRASESASIAAGADAFAASLQGKTQYEKAKAVYDWISSTTVYDANTEDSQNITSVFFNHVSNCAGYSKTFQYLLNRMGIQCTIVEGTAEGNSGVENHAWNLNCLDGHLSYTDVTWGDSENPSISPLYGYLCVPKYILDKTHSTSSDFSYPQCDDVVFSYAVLAGTFFPVYDEQAVFADVTTAVEAGESKLYVQFGNDIAYNQAVSGISNGISALAPVSPSGNQITRILLYQVPELNALVFTY